MRHVRPSGPNACIKTWTFFGYQDEAPELRKKRLMQANLLGPSGLVTIDDNEILACAQNGAAASPYSNSVLEAGKGSGEPITDDGVGRFAPSMIVIAASWIFHLPAETRDKDRLAVSPSKL